MSESTIARTAVDRAAIERWESEGGSALAPEDEALDTPLSALSRSAAENASLGGADSQPRSAREHA